MSDGRRHGDHKVVLTWTPGEPPFRWLPRHGEPSCVLEFISQQLMRFAAYLPVYTAAVSTLTLVIILWVVR